MAYYKVLIEVWCDWDPRKSDLKELPDMLRFAREPFVLFRRSSGLLIVRKKSGMALH